MKTFYFFIGWLCIQFATALFAADIDSKLSTSNEKDAQAAPLTQQARDKLEEASTPEDFREAAALFETALKMEPNDFDSQLTLGWVYLDKLQEPDKAYLHLKKVVKNRPDDVNARKLLAMSCTQTGRRGEAVEQYRKASELQPNDLWIRANLGRSLARQGHYMQANEIFEEVLRVDPANQDARLGKAEVAAWRGHSEASLELLRELLKDNPTNVEALTLMGDIHRWKWKLSEAKEDYRQVLIIATNNYEANTGIKQAKQMGAADVNINGYEFKDTTDFKRESAGLDVRIPLADKAYLLGAAAGWRFSSPGISDIDRIDGRAGLEYHWSRWLETSLEGNVFDYEHRNAFYGGELSAKLTPLIGWDIYTILSENQPFISSIATVTNALRQDSIGNGIDIKLIGPFSIQNSFQWARISDGNTWWEEKPQISLHVLRIPSTYLRAEYDYLSYEKTNTTYWTPRNRHVLSPVLDTSIPLGKGLSLEIDARAPYVFDQSKFGYQLEGGPVLNLFGHLQIKGSYYYSSVPGDQGVWSGQGWQASVRLIF